MTEHLFGLSGDEYWDQPWKNADALHMKFVMNMRKGIFLDAPDVVDPNARQRVPVPLFYVSTGNDERKSSLRDKGKVVAVRLEDRAVLIATALAPEDKVERRPFLPNDDPLSIRDVIDLQERLKVLAASGTYVVRVVNVQKVSNTVAVRVERKKPTSDDPAVVEFLEKQRTPKEFPPPPAPTATLVWKDGTAAGARPQAPEGTPAVPGDLGIALAAERVVLLEEGAHDVLRGSFRLPVLAQERVPAPLVGEPDPDAAPLPEYGEPRPTAIVPVTLLVIGGDTGDVVQFNLQVPTWDALEGTDPVATGTFAVDLLPRLGERPQTHHVYALCGEAFVGPTLTATVSQDMLPKPGE